MKIEIRFLDGPNPKYALFINDTKLMCAFGKSAVRDFSQMPGVDVKEEIFDLFSLESKIHNSEPLTKSQEQKLKDEIDRVLKEIKENK